MNKLKFVRFFVSFGLLLITIISPSILWADSDVQPVYTPAKKFQRGLHNTVTGWMDAPVTVQKFQKERNWFEAWTTGVTRGVGLAIARTGTGIYEAVSFPFAAPEKYEPVMMPERVEG